MLRGAIACVRAVIPAICLALAPCAAIHAADRTATPAVSSSIARQLKAAEVAIQEKQYGVAVARVEEARAVPITRTEYDNYVINAMQVKIYLATDDREKLLPALESLVQNPFVSEQLLTTLYVQLAKREYDSQRFGKAIEVAHQGIERGVPESELAGLISLARWRQTMETRDRQRDRIWRTLPQRRDSPLRYLNVSDDEIREIQAAVAAIAPYDFVSIGGIVTGCPLEEGSACTDQVWVDLQRLGKSRGLQLSRISNRWIIGVIQQWHLCDDALDARRESFRSYHEYAAAKEALVDSFPSCTTQGGESSHQ